MKRGRKGWPPNSSRFAADRQARQIEAAVASAPPASDKDATAVLERLRDSMLAEIEAAKGRVAGVELAMALVSGKSPRRCLTNFVAADGCCLACHAMSGERCREPEANR